METKIKILTGLGFMIEAIDATATLMGRKTVFAYRETDSGMVSLILSDNGTARVLKPNGSVKWYYERSNAQIGALLKQIISANTHKKGETK